MDEQQAREILSGCIKDDGLYSLGWYLSWENRADLCRTACLDGDFTADDLEAIAWWMRNKSRAPSPEVDGKK